MPTTMPDRRQQPREEGEHAVRIGVVARPRAAAPEAIGRQRPHADQGQQEHDLLEHGVHGAKGHQHVGDRIAETGRRGVLGGRRRERGRGIGQEQHGGRERRRDRRGEHRGQQAQDRAGTFRPPPASSLGAQAGRRAEQQRAGQAAADRRLGQRHVGGIEAHPHEREQQAVGDEADDRREGLARGDRPDRRRSARRRRARSRAPTRSSWGRSVAARGIRNELGDGRPGAAARAARRRPA